MYRSNKRNRGVVLLLVLGVLAMFGLIGITFVLLAGQARRGAASQAKVGRTETRSAAFADAVIKQVLRGSNNPASAIGPHSLLEDLYGDPRKVLTWNGIDDDHDEIRYNNGADDDGDGTPDNPEEWIDEADEADLTYKIYYNTLRQSILNGQLFELQIQIFNPDPTITTPEGMSIDTLVPRTDSTQSHIGGVLTMLNGPAAKMSTRIVGYRYDSGTNATYAQILAFEKISTADLIADINTYVNNKGPISYIINGTPFSGTGFGYNPSETGTGPLLTSTDDGETTGNPLALLPNPRSFSSVTTGTQPAYKDPAGPGGANEDYDAPDYQNMLLACVVPQPDGTVKVPIPSLHRPALVNYWQNKNPSLEKRRYILRPLTSDHSDFTGSNDLFKPDWDGIEVGYQWDVDNDGDGVMDSIWVDVGLPVRSTRDGRLYKPLAAILCVDLDGRLNLNAHGCLAQMGNDSRTSALLDASNNANNIVAGGANTLTTTVARGQGVGPAEVNLMALWPTDPDAEKLAKLTKLLTGNGTTVPGRYGWDDGAATKSVFVPGKYLVPSGTAYDYPPSDPLAANKFSNYPGLYDASLSFNSTNNSGTMSYGTPVDLMGGVAVGLDLRGQPLYVADVSGAGQFIGFNPNVGLRADNPYELNLSGASRGMTPLNSTTYVPSDMPFTVNELEAVLRPYDVDSIRLPSRLIDLTINLTTRTSIVQNRHEVTTESWSVPCPGVSLPPELRGDPSVTAWLSTMSMIKINNAADLLKAKIAAETSTSVDATLQTMANHLLSKDLAAGMKMDINRPFGNGRDGNGIDDDSDGIIDDSDESDVNGVVDEPGENELFFQVDNAGNQLAAKAFDIVQNTDVDGDNDVDNDDKTYAQQHDMARQLFARHLYVMMLTLINHDGTDQDVAREVAQWAVNIVDFRDRDSIMTGFEYDVNPFDGWDVDGDLSDSSPDYGQSHCGVVWGCERPEMLITETLAFHDRRTEDLDAGGGTVNDEDEPDPGTAVKDFDQRVRPEGSLFIELYNPSSGNEPLPAEFYETDTYGNKGVKLDKCAGNSPVWRMVVAKTDYDPDTIEDPDDPDTSKNPTIERTVYFTDPSGDSNITDSGRAYYPNPNTGQTPQKSPMSVLLPGRYAVVGPGLPEQSTGDHITYIGFNSSSTYEQLPVTPTIADYNDTSTRRIQMTPSDNPDAIQVKVFSNDSNTDDYTSGGLAINQPVAIVINTPDDTSTGNKIRMSVSELIDGYPAYTTGDTYSTIQDTPLDSGSPDKDILFTNGTTSRFRMIYLQRLANPLLPYNKDSNPYRVVDRAQVDLTCFNGIPKKTAADEPVTNGNYKFYSRERGEDEEEVTALDEKLMNLWQVEDPELRPDPPNDSDTPPNAISPVNPTSNTFSEEFDNTLGYLNEGFGTPQADPSGLTTYKGCPSSLAKPFPWITWLNRPYLSEMELLLVPKKRSSQLLSIDESGETVFSILKDTDTPNPYQTAREPFGHLINYFFDDDTNYPAAHNPNWKLHRLLDFVHVPSPFVGTELQGNPATFAVGTHDFLPPFNHIPNRREPGRVNLNTITSQNVLTGLLGDFTAPSWANFMESRGGFNGADMFALDPNLPTRFANPFRSFAGYYNVPNTDVQNAVSSEVNATMLREELGGTHNPLFGYTSASEVNDTDRNPAFRYQLLNRLGSTASTQSNVYAVWVTVGYFEVSPAPAGYNPAIYPDGYQLGQELGSDSGDVTRNRAFYIIDRSLPVGFKRGEDLNVEDAILLRREIE